MDAPQTSRADEPGRHAARRWWWLMGVTALFIAVAVAVTVFGDEDADGPPPQGTPVATIAVASLGAFSVTELDALGVAVGRVVDWLVVEGDRHVYFTVPAGRTNPARVRLLDRARPGVVTVESGLDGVGPLLAAGGGVVYESTAAGQHRLTYAAPGSPPVALVAVDLDRSGIDHVAVAPGGAWVVYRERAAGLADRLWSVTLDGRAVQLAAAAPGGTLGEGVEGPIVLGEDGTVTYFGDPEGDGAAQWYVVPMAGGTPQPASQPPDPG